MPPCHDAVNAILVGCVLDDVARVLQWKLHFVAFHGEDAAVTARHGVHGAGKVGGVGSGSQIVYHVAGGHDAQTRIEQHGSVEDGFVIGFPVFAVALAHVDEVFAVAPCVDEVLQLPHVLLVVQEGVEFIPLVRHPPPARPSPDGEGGGEEVVGSDVGCNLLVVESGNHADACVVLILVEQFLAEAEERDGGHVVILKHDTFVRQGECPLLCHVFRWVAAVVLLLVIVVYFAFPIDVCHHFATSFYARHVTLAARAVLIEKQSCGACFLHLFEYLRQQFGAVEEKNQYRYIYKGWFHGNFVGLGGGYMVIWYVERKNCRIMIVYLVLLFFCIPV